MNAFWIILTGSLVAVCCSLLGCFLVLRRMALLGDAISHSVLPGIVLAYLVAGERNSFFLLLGAGLFGLLTTVGIEFLSKRIRIQTDAAIGTVFTFLFAVGVILIALFAGQVDLDQDCVLYGEIVYVPLELLPIGIPKAVAMLSFVLFLVVLFIVLGYRGLFITTFHEEYAKTLGIVVGFWHYGLMGLVSLTTVASFESVGAVLVVAFLIVIPASAYLLTDKLPAMLGFSVVLSVLASVLGYGLATAVDGSVSGAMVTVSGIVFFVILMVQYVKKYFFKIKKALTVAND